MILGFNQQFCFILSPVLSDKCVWVWPNRRPLTPEGRWWWGTKWLILVGESSPRGWWTSESWTNRPRSSTTSSKSPAYCHIGNSKWFHRWRNYFHFIGILLKFLCFLTTGNWEPVKAPLTRRSSAISSWSLWPSTTSGETSGRNCVAPAWGWMLICLPSPTSHLQCFPLVHTMSTWVKTINNHHRHFIILPCWWYPWPKA